MTQENKKECCSKCKGTATEEKEMNQKEEIKASKDFPEAMKGERPTNWETEFDKLDRLQCFTFGSKQVVKNFIKDLLHSQAEATKLKQHQDLMKIGDILDRYTSWLCKEGYTDADVYAEEPKAVDAFLETLTTEK